MIKINKDYIDDLKSRKIEKIKIFFYNSWCSWTKTDIVEDDFEIIDLVCLNCHLEFISGSLKNYPFFIYVEKKDKEKFENCIITRVEVTDHTWKVKTSFIYNSSEVKERCGCGSSFAFEKKLLKIDLEKLKKNF